MCCEVDNLELLSFLFLLTKDVAVSDSARGFILDAAAALGVLLIGMGFPLLVVDDDEDESCLILPQVCCVNSDCVPLLDVDDKEESCLILPQVCSASKVKVPSFFDKEESGLREALRSVSITRTKRRPPAKSCRPLFALIGNRPAIFYSVKYAKRRSILNENSCWMQRAKSNVHSCRSVDMMTSMFVDAVSDAHVRGHPKAKRD